MFNTFQFKKDKLFVVLVLLTALAINSVVGQDLSNIDKKNPIKVTGGFAANSTVYHATGIQNRRDPLYWMLSANLNFNVLGVAIPFTATITQQNKSFTQPFNQYGLSPRYKAFTFHAGYRNISFSNYTLGGNVFLGGGVEYAPTEGMFRASAMYGRFTKAIDGFYQEGVVTGEPAYERWGYGTKIGFGKVNRSFDLVMFKARDDAGSISKIVADSFNIKPAENFVMAFITNQSIGQRVTFDLEYALSAYTTDIRIQETELESFRYANHLGFLFSPNISSQFNKAILSNVSYNANAYQLRLTYRRIDPEYKTMGSTFLNNDLEDISGNIGWRMFKNKMNLTAGGGLQRNNLDDSQLSRMSRLIGSFSCSYQFSQKLNFNTSYSNFISNTKINNQYVTANQMGLNQNLDSLKYNQVTSNASIGANYNTGNGNVKHAFFLNGNYQQANDSENNNSDFYNGNTGYNVNFIPSDISISSSFCYNHALMKDVKNVSAGPSISINKLFFKKALRSSLSFSALNTYLQGSFAGQNFTVRFANGYKYGKHHNFSMDIAYLTRNGDRAPAFTEVRGSVAYAFSF